MEIRQLEALLEGGEETPTLEVKGAMHWHRALVVDILAMSNVQDGGVIVIGVEDGTFNRQGLTPEQEDTYKIDVMRDQVAPFADPHVDFSVSFPVDDEGRVFAVIEVRPFREIPVVCARDGSDGLYAGAIYFRSMKRRPQSARVSNSHDMREIIETAISRRRSQLTKIGLIGGDDSASILDAELGGL